MGIAVVAAAAAEVVSCRTAQAPLVEEDTVLLAPVEEVGSIAAVEVEEDSFRHLHSCT